MNDDLPRQISYSVKLAARASGMSEHRIRQLVREHKLAARYDGATVLIVARSLDAYIEQLPSTRQVERVCAANGGW